MNRLTPYLTQELGLEITAYYDPSWADHIHRRIQAHDELFILACLDDISMTLEEWLEAHTS